MAKGGSSTSPYPRRVDSDMFSELARTTSMILFAVTRTAMRTAVPITVVPDQAGVGKMLSEPDPSQRPAVVSHRGRLDQVMALVRDQGMILQGDGMLRRSLTFEKKHEDGNIPAGRRIAEGVGLFVTGSNPPYCVARLARRSSVRATPGCGSVWSMRSGRKRRLATASPYDSGVVPKTPRTKPNDSPRSNKPRGALGRVARHVAERTSA